MFHIDDIGGRVDKKHVHICGGAGVDDDACWHDVCRIFEVRERRPIACICIVGRGDLVFRKAVLRCHERHAGQHHNGAAKNRAQND